MMFVNAWQFQSTGLDHTFVESDYEKHMEDRRDVFRHQFLTARETGEKRIQEEGQKTQRHIAQSDRHPSSSSNTSSSLIMWWSQTNPRKRLGLEAFKMAVYLGLPVGAVAIYSNPSVMQSVLNHYKFIEYPPEGPKPPTNKEIWAMINAKDKERAEQAAAEAAGAVARSTAALPALAVTASEELNAEQFPVGGRTQGQNEDCASKKGGWFGWLRRG